MENRIELALKKLFDKKRIVFWYDKKQELRKEFDALSISDVQKIEINNNEYQVKYRVLREQPEQKFLLFKDGPQPDDLNNWLLDVQLAHGEFRTDQVAIWLAELELGLEFSDVISDHVEFFQAAKRRENLRAKLANDDTSGLVRLKMLSVCAASDARMDAILESLLQDLSDDRDEKFKLIERCSLTDFFWEQLSRHFNYQSDEPSLRDFVMELFKSCYAAGTEGEITLNTDALVFLKRWKDSRAFEESFETLSNDCAIGLEIEHDLGKKDFRDLIEIDYFRLIDQKIIVDIVNAVVSRTVTSGNVSLWIRQRRQSHWYKEFENLYEAIEVAARFVALMDEVHLTIENLSDGVQKYCRSWYQLDQLYRKFTYHVQQSGMPTLMGKLSDLVENLYSNNYLLKLNDRWQVFVDQCSEWDATPVMRQNKFFDRHVMPFVRKDNKVCVIISDAMRFEIGDELVSLIRQEDRYSAELEPAISMLPSYTQLGMAALLPNTELIITDNNSAAVKVDGISSQGTDNRTKILKQKTGKNAQAIKSDNLMALNRDECRELFTSNDILYIYHNRIDHTGDKIHSEGQAFKAAEETLDDLIKIVKKLTASNASNILITADHGFIYQNQVLEDSDYLSVEPEGKQVIYRDRRFVLGHGLRDKPELRKFSPSELGLAGDIEVQIPKSINRLRLKGSGSRFVHGGASLQEIVIPVIKINKKRQSDVVQVDVDILKGSSSVIQTGQLAVALYQSEPVTDKVQPRILRAGIYTDQGQLISDSHEVPFNLTSENPRERELQLRFVLSKEADEANGKEVILKLEERHAGTSHWKEYRSVRYTLRKSFTGDFDL